jgi:Polymerase beta, Nucleotidyltransferase
VEDDAFPGHVADRLGELPYVKAVTLGGSRAEGTHRPDSDWDFSIYYRGQFDPQTDYPAALRQRAADVWWGRADATLGYARSYHAPQRRLTQCAGLVAQAACQAAHAVLAARGEWITNEKTLLTRAGLRQVDELIAAARPDEGALRELVDRTSETCRDALREARG